MRYIIHSHFSYLGSGQARWDVIFIVVVFWCELNVYYFTCAMSFQLKVTLTVKQRYTLGKDHLYAVCSQCYKSVMKITDLKYIFANTYWVKTVSVQPIWYVFFNVRVILSSYDYTHWEITSIHHIATNTWERPYQCSC